MTINLTDAIKSAVMTKPRKSWPTFDGNTLARHDFITASEATSCIRSLAFQKHAERQTVPEENFWEKVDDYQFKDMLDKIGPTHEFGYFERGHNVEDWVVSQLKAVAEENEIFAFTGENQVSFYHAEDRVSGTPDGVYVDMMEGVYSLLEFKSTNNPLSQARFAHLAQVQVNMGLIQKLWSEGKFENTGHTLMEEWDGVWSPAKILYTGASNYMEMSEFPIEYDDGVTYEKVRQRAAKLFTKDGKIKKISKLPAEGVAQNKCHFCKFKSRCMEMEEQNKDADTAQRLRDIIARETGEPYTPKFKFDAASGSAEVAEAAVEYDNYKSKEKAAKASADVLADQIKEWLTKNGKHELVVMLNENMDVAISLSEYTRKGSWDGPALVKFLEEHKKTEDDFRKNDIKVKALAVKVKQAEGDAA